MRSKKPGGGSRLIFAVVSFMFMFGGALIIYKDYRFTLESERLATTGLEAAAIVTRKEVESCGSDDSPADCYAITYDFPIASGARHSGKIFPDLVEEIWFDVPAGGEKIPHHKVKVGDQILVKYIPDDPSVHRIQEECRDCADLGWIGDNIPIFFGLFLVLIGGLILYAIRRHLFAAL